MYENFDKIIKHDKTLDESDINLEQIKILKKEETLLQRRGRTKIVKTRKDINK